MSRQQHLKGIMAVFRLTNVFDNKNYSLSEYLNSTQLKSLLTLIEQNIQYYFFTSFNNNPEVGMKSMWALCGYVGDKIADLSNKCKSQRFRYLPLVIRCTKCKKYRKIISEKESLIAEEVI